jgi:membrane protein required for colicin V production
MDLNYVDITIVVIILITALIGFMRGFVWMAIFLATWTAAILLAYTYKEQLAPLLPVNLDNETLQLGLAFLIIFIGTLIAGAIINYLFSKAVSAIGLGTFDRILGMGLGIVLGALGVTLITMLLSFTELPSQEVWAKSKLIPKFKEAAEWIKTLVPESMNEYIDKNIPTGATNSKLMDNTAGTAILTPSSETPSNTTIETPTTPAQ